MQHIHSSGGDSILLLRIMLYLLSWCSGLLSIIMWCHVHGQAMSAIEKMCWCCS